MSKVGTVTARGTSQKGKPTIHLDGQLYYAGGTPLEGLSVGDKIEYDCTSFGDQGNLWSINKGWKLLEGATRPTAEAPKYPPSVPQIIPRTAPEGSAALLAVTDVERPCISNWGAELIRAGVVTDPASLGIWVQAALHALRGN